MNCKNCNSPLEPNARFCATCGASVVGNPTLSVGNPTMPAAPTVSPPRETTMWTPSQQPMPLGMNPQPLSQQASSYPGPDAQTAFSAPTTALSHNAQLQQSKRRGQGNPLGCFLRLVTVLVVLSIILVGVWFLALRPFVNGMVTSKLDSAMGQAVNQIPSLSQSPFPLPIPIPIPIQNKQIPVSETLLDNVMSLSLSSSEPVKDPKFHITEQNVRMEFNVQPNFLPFAIPCAVSFKPTVDDQGNVTIPSVNIEGLANLIVSSDDITPIINRHLKDATTKLNNPISKIDLQTGVIVLTLR